ncbi:MAG: hypothetical protein STSR0008_25700 [Ignavibacterium sp.]
MTSLGIRIIPSLIRYAILEKLDGTIVFQNAESENLIKFPKQCEKIEDKIKFTYDEIERIIRKFPDISAISIKVDEFGSREKLASREKAYITGVVLLYASQKGIQINLFTNTQIKTNSKTVMKDAAYIVTPSSKKWDKEIAYAVCSAAHML